MLPWPRLPELIRSRYLTLVNRWDRQLGQPASSLLRATTSPADSLLWRQVQRDLGVVDTATTAFGDRYGAWGFLELWRTTKPFTPEDLALLTALTPAVTEGLRAALARTFVEPDGAVAPVGPAVVVLGPDLTVRTQTDQAADALLQLLPPGQPMAPIPAAAYNVGAALVAHERGIPRQRPPSALTSSGAASGSRAVSPRFSACWQRAWTASRSPLPSCCPNTPSTTTRRRC
jgi:hypothetical protein